ncbi:unnamed protein product [Calypogeia fissa]
MELYCAGSVAASVFFTPRGEVPCSTCNINAAKADFFMALNITTKGIALQGTSFPGIYPRDSFALGALVMKG